MDNSKKPNEVKPLPKKKKSKRCAQCRRRINLNLFICRCKNEYCPRCRYPSNHKCTFDYKAYGRKQLKKDVLLVIAEKVTKID